MCWFLRFLCLISLQELGDGFYSFSPYCSSSTQFLSSHDPSYNRRNLQDQYRLYVATDRPTSQTQTRPYSFTMPPFTQRQSTQSHVQERVFSHRLNTGYGKTRTKKKSSTQNSKYGKYSPVKRMLRATAPSSTFLETDKEKVIF